MNKTKQAIFESAIKVFSERGYNGSTVDEVAARAGVAKGTLYYHFKSKEEIFKFIVTEGMNIISDEIKAETEVVENPIEKLRALCRVELKLFNKNMDFFKVIMSQLWGNQLRQYELRDIIHNFIDYLEGLIRIIPQEKPLTKENSKVMAYTMFGTLCSAAIYELLNKDESNIEKVIDHITSYVINGICIDSFS